MNESGIAIVMITHNRSREALRSVQRALECREAAQIIVVDNASEDGTAALLRSCFPEVLVVRSETNLAAAARNIGVAIARTPFVALCDDDTWWEPRALAKARRIFELHPDVAVLCARVMVEPRGELDPASRLMEQSPLESTWLPGAALIGFLAGASVVRRSAFLAAHGFDPRLFIGGEEHLLALDLAARGWRIVYVPELGVHHQPSSRRDATGRLHLLLRNAIYIALLRLPWGEAGRECWAAARRAARDGVLGDVLRDLGAALPWLLRGRQIVPPSVVDALRLIRIRTAASEAEVTSQPAADTQPAARAV